MHYHVPLFMESFGRLRSTSGLLREDSFCQLLQQGVSRHLEVETYTWQVWQEATRDSSDIDEGIARELLWVQDHVV